MEQFLSLFQALISLEEQVPQELLKKNLELATDIKMFAEFKILQSLLAEIEVLIVTSEPTTSPWVLSIEHS